MATKMLFRTSVDLGSYNDDSINNDPSMTDSSVYEPIGALMARLMRGEIATPRYEPVYDVSSDMSLNDAFDMVDPTKSDGFDLADTGEVMSKAKRSKAKLDQLVETEKKRQSDEILKSKVATATAQPSASSVSGTPDVITTTKA